MGNYAENLMSRRAMRERRKRKVTEKIWERYVRRIRKQIFAIDKAWDDLPHELPLAERSPTLIHSRLKKIARRASIIESMALDLEYMLIEKGEARGL